MLNRYKLKSRCFVEIDNAIWFPNVCFNALIKLDKHTGKIQLMRKFPDYDVHRTWLYSSMFNIKDSLVFVPHNSSQIVIYNMQTDQFATFELNKKYLKEKENFITGYLYENFVYMFPLRAKCIIKFDVLHNTVKYLELNIEDKTEDSYCFAQQFEVVNEKIYIPFLEWNAVAILDVKEDIIEIKDLNIKGGCTTINYFDGYFYLASTERLEIHCWDTKTGNIETYDCFPEMSKNTDFAFSYAYIFDGKIVFFPDMFNLIISFDINTKKMNIEKEVCNVDETSFKTYFLKENKEKVYVLLSDMDSIGLVDFMEESLHIEHCIELNNFCNTGLIDKFFFENNVRNPFLENEKKLKEYIEMLISFERINEKREDSNKCGKRIFEFAQN